MSHKGANPAGYAYRTRIVVERERRLNQNGQSNTNRLSLESAEVRVISMRHSDSVCRVREKRDSGAGTSDETDTMPL